MSVLPYLTHNILQLYSYLFKKLPQTTTKTKLTTANSQQVLIINDKQQKPKQPPHPNKETEGTKKP